MKDIKKGLIIGFIAIGLVSFIVSFFLGIWIRETTYKENETIETKYGKYQNLDFESQKLNGCNYIILYHNTKPTAIIHDETCDNHKINTK